MRPLLLLLLLLPASWCSAQQPPLVQVSGQVLDATTGRPVYDCLVEHYDLAGKRWAVISTNTEGRFAAFVPASTAFELRIVDENGYAPLAQRVEAIAPGATGAQDLRLVPR